MKKYILIFLLIGLFSCEDDKKSSSTVETETEETTAQKNFPPENAQEERAAVQTEKEEPKELSSADISGKYRKVVDGSPVSDCRCNCIDVSFDSPTEWCIVQDKVYITARTEKSGKDRADLYFVAASKEVNQERPLPWDKFDTNTPIASLSFKPDGSAELDWLGFAIDGEIATDYAIFGKKTLEGTYQKE